MIGLLALTLLAAPALSAAQEVVAEGSWTKKGYAVAGGWTIVDSGDSRSIVLDESFKTRKAPDLKLFLSPMTLDELRDRNATAGSYRIAELEKHSGRQSYPIPAEVDLSAYRSVLIHCEQYSKLWAGAALPAEPVSD